MSAERYGTVPPAVSISGCSRLGFPLTNQQARDIINNAAEVAPFGLNADTIIDPEVRRAWQVDPAKVTIAPAFLQEKLPLLVGDVSKALGLDAEALEGSGPVDLAARREADLDRLADAIEAHVDLASLFAPNRL